MALSPRLDALQSAVLPLGEKQLEVRNRVRTRLENGTYPTEEVPCFCGEQDGFVLAKRDRYGLPVTTVLCPSCGLLRTSPRMNREATATFYGEDYRDLYNAAGNAEQLFTSCQRKGDFLQRNLAKLPGWEEIQVVFEVGCGAGGLLEPFQRTGRYAAGCDLGDEFLAAGRKRGLDLIQGTVDSLVEHCGKKADLICVMHVVEHFLDLEHEMKKLYDALNPGGWLVVEVPGLESITSAYHGDILLYLQNAHTFHFNATTLDFVLRASGFQVLSIDEQVLAFARRPTASEVVSRFAQRPHEEASRTLRFLADVERNFLQKNVAATPPV